MTLKEAIEEYLAGQASEDPAFAEKFAPGKMGACVAYVTSQARKHLQGKNGAVEDTLVYKWARDFFNDGEAEKAEADREPKANSPDEKAETAPQKPEQPKKRTWEEVKRELDERKARKRKRKPAPKADCHEWIPLSFDFGEQEGDRKHEEQDD